MHPEILSKVVMGFESYLSNKGIHLIRANVGDRNESSNKSSNTSSRIRNKSATCNKSPSKGDVGLSLQHIVEELVESGIEDILIVTGRNKNSIEDHFDHSFELDNILAYHGKNELLQKVETIHGMANIYYIRQNHSLGLGHAMC